MGYDYEITYKRGKDNLVEDAISHTFDDHASLSAISMSIPNWLQYVQQGYVNDFYLSTSLDPNPRLYQASRGIKSPKYNFK